MIGIRSDYDCRIEGEVLLILDRNLGGRSVTNDIENVCDDLAGIGVKLDQLLVIYRDSEGIWDGVMTWHNHFLAFRPLRIKDEGEAIRMVRLAGGTTSVGNPQDDCGRPRTLPDLFG